MTENKKKKRKIKGTITIGADPEFLLINRNNTVCNASGYDFFGSSSANSKIGCDGSGVPVEIRPSPKQITDIGSFISDITDIFSIIAEWCQGNGKTIIGGASKDRYNIGGHIHFGGDEFIIAKDKTTMGKIYTNKKNVKKLTDILDIYFIPIINFFIPTKEIYKRGSGSYGNISDVRSQPWGIEYRTPYSFLITPLLTSSMFSLAALLAYNYKKISITMNDSKKSYQYFDLLYHGGDVKEIQKAVYKKIKPKIIRLMSYNSPNPNYNSRILSLFSLIERGKMCKSMDVINNYKPFIKKTSPFYIEYESSYDIKKIRNGIKNNITNKNKGRIYMYVFGSDFHSTEKIVKLSPQLPKLRLPVKHQTIYKKNLMSLKYSIGFTPALARNIAYKSDCMICLVKYLNKLKLTKK